MLNSKPTSLPGDNPTKIRSERLSIHLPPNEFGPAEVLQHEPSNIDIYVDMDNHKWRTG